MKRVYVYRGKRQRIICRHCNKDRVHAGRYLCGTCFYDKKIRVLYPLLRECGPWRRLETERLTSLIREGKNYEEIARIMGRTRQAIGCKASRLGFPLRKPIPNYEVITVRLKNLLDKNPDYTDADLMKLLKVSRHAIIKAKAKLGIPPRDVVARNRLIAKKRCERIKNDPTHRTPLEKQILAVLDLAPATIGEVMERLGYRWYNAIHRALLALHKKNMAFGEHVRGAKEIKWYSTTQWIATNQGLIANLAGKIYKINKDHVEYDDVFSQLTSDIVSFVRYFKWTSRVKFSTGITYACKHTIAWAMGEKLHGVYMPEAVRFEKNREEAAHFSLSDDLSGIHEPAAPEVDTERRVDCDRMAREVWKIIDKTLPKRYAGVLKDIYLKGKSLNEIGEAQGVSRSMISHIQRTAYEKLRNTGLLDHFCNA